MRLANQTLIELWPELRIVTVPLSSTLATDWLVELNFAQRVTSSIRPLLYLAVT